MKFFTKKLLGHWKFSSMIRWTTKYFFKKICITSDSSSYILNVYSLTTDIFHWLYLITAIIRFLKVIQLRKGLLCLENVIDSNVEYLTLNYNSLKVFIFCHYQFPYRTYSYVLSVRYVVYNLEIHFITKNTRPG